MCAGLGQPVVYGARRGGTPMVQGSTDTIHATDGTPLDFKWAVPDGAMQSWRRDMAHWPRPFTPMELWFYEHGWGGADRAWEEAGLIPLHRFHRWQFVGPFLYGRISPEAGERGDEIIRRLVSAGREHGGGLNFWRDFCEPRIRQVIEATPREPTIDTFADIAETFLYGWHQTFTSLSVLFPVMTQLEQIISVPGVDAAAIAQDLVAGDENPSQGIDDAIWEISASVRGSETARLIEAGESLSTIRSMPGTATFIASLDALVAEHRDRTFEWCMTGPTWEERPDAVLDLVRAVLRPGSRSPLEVHAAASARRETLMAEVIAGIPADALDRFNQCLSLLRGYVTVREERAYLQMVLCGRTRRMLLEYADSLVRDGRLAHRDDILFVTPDAIRREGPLHAQVDRGRADWERWSQLETPAMIGAPLAVDPEAPTSNETTLVGVAGSRGVTTGPARVVHDPFEVTDLEPGEILVCVTTTPAWTPLLAMAAAVVTETGNAFAHPAIASREYGIPCVVSATGATVQISNGQIITVDGDRGVVVTQ